MPGAFLGMMLDLVMNLTFLISLTILSEFVDRRWPRDGLPGAMLQGVLFGTAALVGMMHPLDLGAGLIFDGRSIMISLVAWYFGPVSAAIAIAMTSALRISIGGAGVYMGLSVILSSGFIGLTARHFKKPEREPPTNLWLLMFGLAVHVAMVTCMLLLPDSVRMKTIRTLALPIVTMYPLATVLAGKILSDQLSARRMVETLRASEERLQRSVAEKEVLLREVHHRVKNNLNVVSSLLSLQSNSITSPERAMDAFAHSRERIMAMALVHEELYKSDDFARVDMESYVRRLVNNLADAMGTCNRVDIHLDIRNVKMSVSTSVPCGLILNELVTNALKYAFPDNRTGTIQLTMYKEDDAQVHIDFSDNGIGLAKPYEELSNITGGSLGMTLIGLLVSQLDGKIDVQSSTTGTRFTILCTGG